MTEYGQEPQVEQETLATGEPAAVAADEADDDLQDEAAGDESGPF